MPDRLPSLVPQFHFYFYLRALGYLLAGLGVWSLIRVLVSKVPRAPWALIASRLAATAVVWIASAAWYDDFQRRPDFNEYRREALDWSRDLATSRLFARLREQTSTDAVILANFDDAIFRVAPAGRAVVAVRSEFSNPYVDHERRSEDQKAMIAALLAGDVAAFRRLAEPYGVTHVLLGPAEAEALDREPVRSALKELSNEGGYALLSVPPDARGGRN